MPQIRYSKHGKIVNKYYVHSFVIACICDDSKAMDRVKDFRKIVANEGDKRLVRACNFVLGWLGDERQEYSNPSSWPIELREELDRVIWRAEGI